tara:strand:- start:2372 stop:2560 length:189 start_codon:yes stop_codon:yes gene_type:complete
VEDVETPRHFSNAIREHQVRNVADLVDDSVSLHCSKNSQSLQNLPWFNAFVPQSSDTLALPD